MCDDVDEKYDKYSKGASALSKLALLTCVKNEQVNNVIERIIGTQHFVSL